MKTPTVDLPTKVLSSSRRNATSNVNSRPSVPTAFAAPTDHPVSQDRVALLAYQLWERDGCPHGNDLHYWHTAEQQLRLGR